MHETKMTIWTERKTHLRNNQSIEHNKLCDIARAYLASVNCRYVGTEVNIGVDISRTNPRRCIIDALGVGKIQKVAETSYEYGYKSTKTKTEWVSRGIEAKATLSDFKNGFIDNGLDYIYIIAPIGVIPKKLIPKKIGFIEADINKAKILTGVGYNVSGIKLVKRPSKLDGFRHGNDILIKDICKALTSESLRWKSSIPIIAPIQIPVKDRHKYKEY